MAERDWLLYVDAKGRSEIGDQLRRIDKSNERASRAIHAAIKLVCREPKLDALLGTRWLKKPSATLYVLRVQTGPLGYRLPFFEPKCRDGTVLVFTHCEKRARLTAGSYADLIEEAERRRADWIERKCKE